MNSDGKIAFGAAQALIALGYTIPLSDAEAQALLARPESERLELISAARHGQIAKKRREKYPGQSTAYLVGVNHPGRQP